MNHYPIQIPLGSQMLPRLVGSSRRVDKQSTPKALATALKKLSSDHISHLAPHKLRVVLDYPHPPLIESLQALENAIVT